MYGAVDPNTVYGPQSCGGCQSGYDDTSGEYQGMIRTFQTMLKDLGYLDASVTPSGLYGAQTYRAVTAFQQDFLPDDSVDGRIGPTTGRYIVSQHSAALADVSRAASMAEESVTREQITEAGDVRQEAYVAHQRSLKGRIQALPRWVLPTTGGTLLLLLALVIRRRRA